MEKITLSKVQRFTKDKEGNPLKTRDGRPYTRVMIECAQKPGVRMSGFGNKDNEMWSEGDEVEVIIEQKGQYFNFSMPKKEDITATTIEDLRKRIITLEFAVGGLKSNMETLMGMKKEIKPADDYPEYDGEPPF